MRFKKFVELRDSNYNTEPDRITAFVDMDEVVIVTREPFQEIDCYKFFLKCGYALYVDATLEAAELVKGLVI